MASRTGAQFSHFFIYSLQKLPKDSVGPLLKAVEEAKFARFIFQSQSVPRKVQTLMSRSSVVKLPFLPRKLVFFNMKVTNHDAKTADDLGLYDGTLGGTIRALGMKDSMTSIKREMKKGTRGLAALFSPDVLNSTAFEAGTYGAFSPKERQFLWEGTREATPEMKKVALFLAMRRPL